MAVTFTGMISSTTFLYPVQSALEVNNTNHVIGHPACPMGHMVRYYLMVRADRTLALCLPFLTPRSENTVGVLYTLNFSVPFNMSQNISALFQEQRKAGDGLANNIAPTYVDGAMLANDDEYFLYGGLSIKTDTSTDQDANEIREWQGYDYGVEKPQFAPGFKTVQPTNLTRYLAYGGASNVPSENLAFYFSGMRAPDWGKVYYPSGDESLTASVVSDTLITVDMAVQDYETWSNVTIPSDIPGRANPELVWVPVGEKGILVALGGVVYPEFITGYHASDNQSASVSRG